MKPAKRMLPFVLAVCLLLTGASCADMGAGDDETAFYDYFDMVFLISRDGGRVTFIEQFNTAMSLSDSEEIKEVVPDREYAYIAFRVAPEYTLTVDEFAFFFRGSGGEANPADAEGKLTVMDFYITDKIPTKLEGDGQGDPVYLPDVSSGFSPDTSGEEQTYIPETDSDGSVSERPGEVDESMFNMPAYATSRVYIRESWNSAHLCFETPQTVRGGQFVVIRVRNNCHTQNAPGEATVSRVRFTFNHLMFRFGSANKE